MKESVCNMTEITTQITTQITTISLNPCIDWQYNIPALSHGGLNRVSIGSSYATSKAINVAVVLKNLGHHPTVMGINFAQGGQDITSRLDKRGIPHHFVTVPGRVRVNVKLWETNANIMTELNQPGTFVPETYVQELLAKIKAIPHKYAATSILVLSGSLPAGMPANIYQQILAIWPSQAQGGRVFLDAEGESLKLALAATNPPYAIKPNIYELEATFGQKFATREDIVAFCQEHLFATGLQVVMVSMGSEGAMLITPRESFYQPAAQNITVKGLAGAGDSMVAGAIHALISHQNKSRQNKTPVGSADHANMLKYATAAATGSVTKIGTSLCTMEDFEKYVQ